MLLDIKMPRTPKQTTCRELGCKNPKVNGSTFCNDHGGSLTETRRSFNKLYNTKQWKQFRQIQLSKHPICARCQSLGKIAPAHHVDHIIPHKQDRDKWMGNRFQSLCHECHSIKTALEKQGEAHDYTRGEIIPL